MNKLELFHDLARDITVLYAEDEAGVRASTVELLENFFPKILPARDGQEAWEIWQQQHPELIITDVRMPKMDGLQLAQKVHEVNFQQRIVAISAYSDTPSLVKLLHEGISGFLLKPLEVNKLIDLLLRELKIIHSQKHEATALQDLAKEIERRSKALDQANRSISLLLQSRENMLRLVAHELRNPLNSLNGFLQLLQSQLHHQPEYAEYFDYLFKSTSRLEQSTQKALDLIRITSSLETHKEWLALKAIFFPHRDTVALPTAIGNYRLLGNPVLFSLVTENILENWQKYGKPPYELELEMGDDNLQIHLRDHGQGFSPQTLEKIQRGPFSSGDIFHHHEGFGLGLEIIRTSLAKMDIDLKLSNHPEGGARYTLIVPKQGFRTGDDLSSNSTPGERVEGQD